ncbi:NAD(P)H-dependent FMN reductase [Rhodococcus sp. 27YEA15]|uniref:NADPH-dependent FMN reductase n=1 Tax=Rhodococcus sp. 27YEA15 TaxID=3156259 RepID=UPI003C7CBDB8
MTEVNVEIIVGSVRAGRIGRAVADWFAEQAVAKAGWNVTVLDLVDAALPVDFSVTSATAEFRERIGRADILVAVTPEYNHGYPAALKTAFDSAKYEWRAKPIGFVSYGGIAGGLRATEQLRQVVAELHMVSVRQSVSIHQARKRFRDGRAVVDPVSVDACAKMIEQLDWWGRGLRDSRETAEYPG